MIRDFHLYETADTTDGRLGASTIILATITGLLHDYFATGDLKRTTAGLNFFTGALSNEASSTARKNKKKGH